jgi:hypothetical protein
MKAICTDLNESPAPHHGTAADDQQRVDDLMKQAARFDASAQPAPPLNEVSQVVHAIDCVGTR